MGANDIEMMDWVANIVRDGELDDELVERTFKREEIMDNVQGEVIEFLTTLLSANVPYSVARECRVQLRVADEPESISDYVTGILKTNLKLRDSEHKLSADERSVIDDLHRRSPESLRAALVNFERPDADQAKAVARLSRGIARTAKEARGEHLLRLSDERIEPTRSMAFTRLIRGYRKLSNHTLNVAEALADK